MASPVVPRQETTTIAPIATGIPNGGSTMDDNRDYYYEGDAIKYAVVGGIAAFFFAWIILGTMHARHRVRNGKKPLLYHRWLAPTYRRTSQYGQGPFVPYGAHAYYRPGYGGPPRPGDAYHMADWQQPPPPPAYSSDGPPAYNPPDGASKVDPYQHMREPRAGESSASQADPLSSTAAPQIPEPSHQLNNVR